ncbi:hypothetical protein AURDEDRAFT_168356 [Auricularia subglabra TFB-10046 SS5]|nr:hypothetical protein AURDEDRAFT_168356 [Auricularia subglabra TFB-10046 SS5]
MNDDGGVTLTVPTWPRDTSALLSSDPGSSDALLSFEPPPFPSFAPYKHLRHRAWSHLQLFIAAQLSDLTLYPQDAQNRLLHYIISYLRDDLHIHLPCFWDKTSAQLQAIVEREHFLWHALQRVISDLDDDLALQTIVHYCAPGMSALPPLDPTGDPPPPDAQPSENRDGEASDPAHAGSSPHPSVLGSSTSELSKIPHFKPLLFKGQIEGTRNWMDVVFFARDTFCALPAADVATREELARAVCGLVSYLNAQKLARTPLFDDMSSNQLVALLERDPLLEDAVRHLRVQASIRRYYEFFTALRVVVNYLCQRPKGAQNPAQHVRIALPEAY